MMNINSGFIKHKANETPVKYKVCFFIKDSLYEIQEEFLSNENADKCLSEILSALK